MPLIFMPPPYYSHSKHGVSSVSSDDSYSTHSGNVLKSMDLTHSQVCDSDSQTVNPSKLSFSMDRMRGIFSRK